jgi:hypothetical protein
MCVLVVLVLPMGLLDVREALQLHPTEDVTGALSRSLHRSDELLRHLRALLAAEVHEHALVQERLDAEMLAQGLVLDARLQSQVPLLGGVFDLDGDGAALDEDLDVPVPLEGVPGLQRVGIQLYKFTFNTFNQAQNKRQNLETPRCLELLSASSSGELEVVDGSLREPLLDHCVQQGVDALLEARRIRTQACECEECPAQGARTEQGLDVLVDLCPVALCCQDGLEGPLGQDQRQEPCMSLQVGGRLDAGLLEPAELPRQAVVEVRLRHLPRHCIA